MPVNDYLLLLFQLTGTLTDAIVCLDTMLICCCLLNTIIVIIIEFWDFSWSLICCTQVSVLVLGIGIARGQYYWVLDIGCLSWYRSWTLVTAIALLKQTTCIWAVACIYSFAAMLLFRWKLLVIFAVITIAVRRFYQGMHCIFMCMSVLWAWSLRLGQLIEKGSDLMWWLIRASYICWCRKWHIAAFDHSSCVLSLHLCLVFI